MTEKEQNIQKKEYLNSYKKQCQKIRSLEEQLESIRTSLESAKGQVITDMPRSGHQSDLSDSIVKLDSVISKIVRAKIKKLNTKAEIEDAIADMEEGIEAQILHKRYIEFKPWEQICCEVGYSWMQTHRLHSMALSKFKMIYNDTQESAIV